MKLEWHNVLAQSWLDWWLGLDALRTSDGEIGLGWQYALPLWGWAAVALVACLLAGWSYHRLIGPRWARLGLAGARAALLVFLALMLAGPLLVRVTEQVEPDRLLMLVDRSGSMQVKDMADADGAPMSRDTAVTQALSAQREVFEAKAMTQQRQVRWFGFGGEAFPIPSPHASGSETLTLPPADRQATRLRTAMNQALSRSSTSRIAGVVLMTDGRSPQPTAASLTRRLDQRAIPVFAVPVGAEQLPLDLALSEVEAPERAFADDLVPVTATVEQVGGSDDQLPERVTLRLIDAATDKVVDTQTIPRDRLGERIRLTARPETPGATRYRVEVTTAGATGDERRELNRDNNERTVSVRVIDRPLRVLYVEGYPRWEYRFLKNLLIREQSIESSIMLLSAGSDFAQEGDVPINRLPRTAEEFRRYDVILIGDVASGTFSDQQKSLIKNHVATSGAGVLWIGGPRAMASDYGGTALSELLPMARPASVSRFGSATTRIRMRPTPFAERLSVLRLRGTDQTAAESNEPGAGETPAWPDDLPPLRWAQRVGPLKPATEVLARASDATAEGRRLPLVTRMRYGSGQTLYVATDETWRWRYGRGELYFQQYWIQLLRMLGRGRVQELSGRARLETAHRRIDLGQTTVVTLRLTDASIAQQGLAGVEVAVRRAGDSDDRVDELRLRPAGQAGESSRVYRATWQPAATGRLVLTVAEPGLAGFELSESIEVAAPGDELANPRTDHDRLERLAGETGGAVIPLDQLGRLKTAVPNRARITTEQTTEPIRQSPLALLLGLMLLTGEWVGRKVIRLV